VQGLPRWATLLALPMFDGNVAQIPLGGLTVLFHLHPLLVMAHFLLALAVLGGAAVLVVESERLVVGPATSRTPRGLRLAGLALAGSCLVLVVTGAFATAAGPHSGGDDIRRLGEPLRSVYVHAAATAVFGISLALLVGWLFLRRARFPKLFSASLWVVALLALQIAVGELQYHRDLPWTLVLVHVALAAGVWAATVALATLFIRTPRSAT
jgi:cytochrome c oxidase assembly protein subunit 15